MKNKFQRMTKKEKKELIKSYRSESKKNDNYIHTLNRMLIFAIIGFIYGFLMMLMDIFILHTSVWSIIVDSIVMIFTTFLIVQRNNIYTGTLNNYAIDKSTVVIKKSETTKRKHVSKNAQSKKKSKKD